MTLLELIVVILITSIIATGIVVFLQRPTRGYTDAARRAELTDIADTALRRITRDLRSALPNSVRVDATGRFVEYLQTSGGGRYRAAVDSGGAGDVLDFAATDGAFDVIGPMPTLAAGNSIVVYNLNAGTGVSTSNAYAGDNREAYASNTATTITLAAPKQFPFSSQGNRFQVVQYPVTYQCDLVNGVLRRYWNYPIQHNPQPTPPAAGSNALLASSVTDCSFTYSTGGAGGRTSVVSLSLQIEQDGEKVRLFQQVHVNNVP